MIKESTLEAKIIELITANATLAKLTTKATVQALNPLDYEVNNDIGAILVSCNGSDASGDMFAKARFNREFRFTVSLGVRNLTSNEELWDYKNLITSVLDYVKPFSYMSRIYPVNDFPKYPTPINGVFWVEMNYKINNYMS